MRQGLEQCDGSSAGCTDCTINAGWVCFDSQSGSNKGSTCYEREKFASRFQELQSQGVKGCRAKSKLASFRITDFALGSGICTRPGESIKPASLMSSELVSTSKQWMRLESITLNKVMVLSHADPPKRIFRFLLTHG